MIRRNPKQPQNNCSHRRDEVPCLILRQGSRHLLSNLQTCQFNHLPVKLSWNTFLSFCPRSSYCLLLRHRTWNSWAPHYSCVWQIISWFERGRQMFGATTILVRICIPASGLRCQKYELDQMRGSTCLSPEKAVEWGWIKGAAGRLKIHRLKDSHVFAQMCNSICTILKREEKAQSTNGKQKHRLDKGSKSTQFKTKLSWMNS